MPVFLYSIAPYTDDSAAETESTYATEPVTLAAGAGADEVDGSVMTAAPPAVLEGSGDGVAAASLLEQAQSISSIAMMNIESSFFISSLRGGFVL
ncbi:hypothetical protein SDC9_152391 [bioreactor metagenome]|uniref:Uncharacterized protein n=1 Tax=bioreactor metagenome TaxID=1076179 RepID=A0A645ESX8_9ZZZZ